MCFMLAIVSTSAGREAFSGHVAAQKKGAIMARQIGTPPLETTFTRGRVRPPSTPIAAPQLFEGVPTDDPAAALAFCRSLATLLATAQPEVLHTQRASVPHLTLPT